MNAPTRQLLLISAALVFLVLLAFEPARHNAFIEFDDNQYLLENPHIQSGFTSGSVAWAFSSGYASNWHPLTWLSHMLDIELFELNPAGHHWHNVLLHALSVVLLFLVLHNMTGAVWRSAFVAMLFGLHPLRVESVAWAAERKDVLAAVFWMLTIAAYVHYTRHRSAPRYLLVVLCLALGLMAKPMLVSLPLVLLVLDFWPLKRMRTSNPPAENTGAISFPRLFAEKVPLFIVAAISCVITFLVQRHGHSVSLDLPFVFRVANALTSYVAYIGKLFWPANLAMLYPYPTTWPIWKPITAAALLLLASLLAKNHASRQPWLAAGWLWYLITLIPVIGIIQAGGQSMADRYTYLPSIGILVMIVWSAAELSRSWPRQREIFAVAGGLIALLLIVETRMQVNRWKDSVTLFEHTLAVTRNNHTIHHTLGWTLANEGRFDEALIHLNRSLQLRPNPATHLDIAHVLIQRGHFDEATAHLQKVLSAQPTNAVAHYDMGVILQAAGKPDEAISAYECAVRSDPNQHGALNNLGILKSQKGLFTEAIDYFRRSLRAAPDRAPTHRNLGAVLQMEGQVPQAVEHFRTALRLDPQDEQASWHLAYALHQLGNLREAAEYDRYTLRLNPGHVGALNDLAWILATSPDRQMRNADEAIQLASRASQLTDAKEPDILDTLATAFASANRFSEAIETAQKAIALARAAGQDELAREIDRRLQLYRSSTPYIETPPAPGLVQ